MKFLAEEPLHTSVFAPGPAFAGRRLRVFARLVRLQYFATDCAGYVIIRQTDSERIERLTDAPTYAHALRMAAADPDWQAHFASLALREDGGGIVSDRPQQVSDRSQFQPQGRDWELPIALQDLANEICEDIRAACAAFNDPDVWYPGVDVGIAPVSDAHVQLVIAAMQRELGRETRPGPATRHYGAFGGNLPAVPLAELPFRVQRALVERRRLRFTEYGIGQAEWEAGTWSLWNVRDDPDWLPRRQGT